MRKIILAGAVFSSFSFALVDGELSLGVWSQNPKGYIQYPADGGTPLDLERDLGLGDETRFTGKVKLELPSILPNIYLQYTHMEFSGTNRVNNVRFGDYIFNATVNTDVKANQFDVGFYYHLPFVKGDLLDPEVGLIVKVVDFKATVYGQATEVNTRITGTYSESTSETVPLPLLYLHLGIYPHRYVGVLGEFKGVKAGDDYFYEYSVGLRVRPFHFAFGNLFVEGGFRYQRLRLKDVGDINADVRVGGVYGVAGVSF